MKRPEKYIKRYRFDKNIDMMGECYCNPEVVQDPKGDYIKYDDATAFLPSEEELYGIVLSPDDGIPILLRVDDAKRITKAIHKRLS